MARNIIHALFALDPFLDLDVNGAVQNGAGQWVADFNPVAGNYITIDGDANLGVAIAWAIAGPAGSAPVGAVNPGDADQYRIPLDNAANVVDAAGAITVTATAGPVTQTVQIVIKPLVTGLGVVANHYAFQDEQANWYAYDLSSFLSCREAATTTAALEVTTNPATAAGYSHVQWNAVDTLNNNAVYALSVLTPQRRGIRLDAVGRIKTELAMADTAQAMPAAVTVDVRSPTTGANLANNLQIRLWSFKFAGAGHFDVTQESRANFNARYSAYWEAKEPVRPPQGYVANRNMTLETVRIELLRRPSQRTTVHIRPTAIFKKDDGTLSVQRGAARSTNIYSISLLTDKPSVGDFDLGNVPDEVMYNDPLLVFWEASTDGGNNWAPLEVTGNTVYVTAAPPAACIKTDLNRRGGAVYTYDSLLAISCEAAKGVAGGGAVRDRIAASFNLGAGGQNTHVKRLNRGAGSPTELSYWYQHGAGRRPAQSINGDPTINGVDNGNLFTNPLGNIACGVWAQMLIAMWALHGKNDGRFIGVYTRQPGNARIPPPGIRFLVRNWDYNNHGALNNNGFSHSIVAPPVPAGGANRAAPVDGLAGQNNGNPPAQFMNHFIVRDGNGGTFFDPSYGTVNLAKNAWIDGAVAGLRDDAGVGAPIAGYVTNNVGSPNNILPNRNAVVLYDFASRTIIP